ncbi:MAG: hypothetical protein FGM14_10920 [Flavobacteriales bacterium]|nr:hypothetical protein [Flavobacteriales bacterium]
MSNKRLYIIGNGFDIFHGVKSRYSDFKDYVEKNDNDLFEALEEYFNTDELWSDFEETLAYIDTDKIVDDASDFLVSYGADDWSDAYHHDYQYEVQRAINVVTVALKEHFTKWILSLDIPNKVKLKLPAASLYLTFNYTDILERNYKISPSKIIYIHNKAINESSTLILGHSRQPTPDNSFDNEVDWEDQDVRVSEGNRILDNYFEETYKNTDTIIKEKQSFFGQLSNIEEVFVLGHSISPVDIKYFQTVFNTVSKNATWTVSYYSDDQKDKLTETLISIGVTVNKINLVKLIDL